MRHIRSPIALGFLVLFVVPLAIISLREPVPSAFPARGGLLPAKPPDPPLGLPWRLGQHYDVEYLSRFPAATDVPRGLFFIEDLRLLGDEGSRRIVLNSLFQRSLQRRLTQLAENVFAPSAGLAEGEIEAAYASLLAAGVASVPYMMPHVFSAHNLDQRCAVLLPPARCGFSPFRWQAPEIISRACLAELMRNGSE